MTSQRYDIGREMLSRVDGESGEKVMQALQDIAPDIEKYVVEFTFGDIYTRKGLDLKQREMITISSLLSLGGCEKQLNVHINAALHVGLSPHEIVETMIQCIPYVGFPRVLNAIFVAKQVFAERHVSVTQQ